ncbi:hypothetical protein CPJCM30710_22620 [Clostridium polyendosporum]|uniref:Uncharacterized protein n=1 Tax=Clostridium polyendosporum TaxID=69208 RepID=A0A919VHE4_9CLOT|nr:hypothetical protein [Clostridium polyendosporum]GIM29596.1 hypothetical protein CPJCM30710_22620 [Clostridium polyendosporum]
MKYGIDITNRMISVKVIKALKKRGQAVIDFREIQTPFLGENLYKKVLLANQTRIDIYVSLNEVSGEKDSISIFSGMNEVELRFVSQFKKEMLNIGFKEFNIINGSNFYLIKNIKAPCLIITIEKYMISLDNNDLSEKIVNALMSLLNANS